jgi:hypothetical protein
MSVGRISYAAIPSLSVKVESQRIVQDLGNVHRVCISGTGEYTLVTLTPMGHSEDIRSEYWSTTSISNMYDYRNLYLWMRHSGLALGSWCDPRNVVR